MNILLEADYGQIEVRIMAWLSGDTSMLQAYREGRDIYTETARDVLLVQDVDKAARQKAKPVVLGFQYGMGAPKFRTYAFMEYGVRFTQDEAEQIRRRFFHKYNGLTTYYMRQESEARRTLQVRTPLGRIRRLPDILSPDKEIRQEAIRQAINAPVQSVASDLTLLAAIEARKVLPSQCQLIALVHDSLLWEIPEVDAKMVAGVLYGIMTQTVPAIVQERFGVEIGVPLDADVKIGTRWGSLKEVDKTTLIGYHRK